MKELIDQVMAEIEADPTINAKEINLDVQSKGFLKRRKLLNVNGMVDSAAEMESVLRIVQRQAGDNYDVVNKLVVM